MLAKSELKRLIKIDNMGLIKQQTVCIKFILHQSELSNMLAVSPLHLPKFISRNSAYYQNYASETNR